MSLYYEAAAVIANSESKGGSLKNRIFGNKDLKSNPASVFALCAEATKWSEVLKEVIEKSDVLKLEKKLTPTLALLLVHDLLLAKKGVFAPKDHVLNLAISRHKARLSAEFTKCRLRRGFPSIEAFRADINNGASTSTESGDSAVAFHPRWIRVNAVRTSTAKALATTFKDFTVVKTLEELATAPKGVYRDEHIPDLLAIQPSVDLSKHAAYRAGEIIFQDKASCFPAYLLDPQPRDGHVIDACAAPGNKTTHLAAIMSASKANTGAKVTACERNEDRAKILSKMVKLAGAGSIVTVKAAQDFTRIKAQSNDYADVGALLLDPSCSGSGIIGREDTAVLHLPSTSASSAQQSTNSRKRKRKNTDTAAAEVIVEAPAQTNELSEETPEQETDAEKLKTRLANLSAFQLKIVLHAFSFPAATKVAYSTCSIHAEENEHVVLKALASDVAKQQGWRILKREDQVEGMKKWNRRGEVAACKSVAEQEGFDLQEIADACIRCQASTDEGTMGFFVAAFVRDPAGHANEQPPSISEDNGDGEEWGGFSDEEGTEA
ncbi:hypothetical protein MBLNU459_g0459t1 [Dothideomycetes sp. NU459]